MMVSSTEPNGWSRIVDSAASIPPALSASYVIAAQPNRPSNDAQRYSFGAVANCAEPPNRRRSTLSSSSSMKFCFMPFTTWATPMPITIAPMRASRTCPNGTP